MGHIVNPYLFRLNYVISWSTALIVNKKFSAYFDTRNIFMNDFIVSFFKTKKSITKNMLYLLFFKLVYNNNTFTLFLVFKQHRNFFKRKSKKILLKKLSKNLLFIYNKKFMTKYLFYRKSNVSLVCNLNSVNIFLKKKLKKKIFNNFSLAKKILIKKLIKRKKKFKVKKFKIRKKLINRKKYEKEENIKYKKFMFLPNISKPTRKIVFKVDLARCFVYKKINFKNSYVVRLKKKKKKRRRRRKHIFIRKKAMYKAKLYCRFIIKLKSKSQNFFINKRLISIFKRRLVRRRFIRRYLKRQKKKKRKRRLRIRKRKFLHSLKRAWRKRNRRLNYGFRFLNKLQRQQKWRQKHRNLIKLKNFKTHLEKTSKKNKLKFKKKLFVFTKVGRKKQKLWYVRKKRRRRIYFNAKLVKKILIGILKNRRRNRYRRVMMRFRTKFITQKIFNKKSTKIYNRVKYRFKVLKAFKKLKKRSNSRKFIAKFYNQYVKPLLKKRNKRKGRFKNKNERKHYFGRKYNKPQSLPFNIINFPKTYPAWKIGRKRYLNWKKNKKIRKDKKRLKSKFKRKYLFEHKPKTSFKLKFTNRFLKKKTNLEIKHIKKKRKILKTKKKLKKCLLFKKLSHNFFKEIRQLRKNKKLKMVRKFKKFKIKYSRKKVKIFRPKPIKFKKKSKYTLDLRPKPIKFKKKSKYTLDFKTKPKLLIAKKKISRKNFKKIKQIKKFSKPVKFKFFKDLQKFTKIKKFINLQKFTKIKKTLKFKNKYYLLRIIKNFHKRAKKILMRKKKYKRKWFKYGRRRRRRRKKIRRRRKFRNFKKQEELKIIKNYLQNKYLKKFFKKRWEKLMEKNKKIKLKNSDEKVNESLNKNIADAENNRFKKSLKKNIREKKKPLKKIYNLLKMSKKSFKKKKIKFIFKKLLSKIFLFEHYIKILKLKKELILIFHILFPKMDINIFMIIKSYWSSFITSNMIAEYFILRLLQRRLLVEIMKPMIKFLNKSFKKKKIYGYAILLMGRFTRKDRALYRWYKKGPFTKSNRLINIDYANKRVYLKFSTCSFKISLIRTIGYKVR